jgi:hypothetical protein
MFYAAAGYILPGRLQPCFDIAQHCQHLGRVGIVLQQHLAFLHRECVRTDVKICFRQLPRGEEGIIPAPELAVRFL